MIIDEPLPLLPIKHKNQHLIGNLPKFKYKTRVDREDSDEEFDEVEPLGSIIGKPPKEVIVTERDLLIYLKDSYAN